MRARGESSKGWVDCVPWKGFSTGGKSTVDPLQRIHVDWLMHGKVAIM